MYYFNVLEILEEKKELTTADLYIEHKLRYGYVNRNSLGKALKKLLECKKIQVDKRNIENKRGVFYFYSLKDNIIKKKTNK